mgnify:CR=1 FL=1
MCTVLQFFEGMSTVHLCLSTNRAFTLKWAPHVSACGCMLRTSLLRTRCLQGAQPLLT